MSLHYLLDGYNITNQIPALAPKKLEDKRSDLISQIEMYQPQGSAKNSVTVVFDGKPGMWGAPASATVKVIFATEESADDKIKDIVRQAQNKKQIVVVTDDRDIKYAVRALGATVMSVADFLTKLKPRPEKSRLAPALREPPESTKGIPKTIEYQITAEMEKIWLTPKEKRKEQSR